VTFIKRIPRYNPVKSAGHPEDTELKMGRGHKGGERRDVVLNKQLSVIKTHALIPFFHLVVGLETAKKHTHKKTTIK
jgi:hypothetical protein